MADALFRGTGLAVPFRADPGGRLVLSSGVDKIEESIRLVLGTRRGERPMRPTFGCAAHELVLAPAASPRTTAAVARAVEEALALWEPRIEVTAVTAWASDDDPPVLHAEVEYRVRETNDPRNLVHPFYAIPPEPGTPPAPAPGLPSSSGEVRT